jgi:hypothetical protein
MAEIPQCAKHRAGGSIEYIDDADYRAASVARALERQRQTGYDRDVADGEMASLEALEGLPMVGDVMKVFTRPGSGRAIQSHLHIRLLTRILMQDGQASSVTSSNP